MSNAKNDETEDNNDVSLDFTTSSAISRVNIKFLAVYIPIFWLSGILLGVFWYEWIKNHPPIMEDWGPWIGTLIFLPYAIFAMFFIFILSCTILSKLFLILINLIHKPKEGVFKAEIGDADFEFWCLRTELKKLVLWLIRNFPIPWLDSLAFRWFGIKMDFSSHLPDAWCDIEFVKLGRRVLVGQGAVVMSSMVIGKYLIIKKVILNDYTVVGGMACVSPGTITGRDSLVGAISATVLNQVLEAGWIYFGIPCIKMQPNKLALVKEMTKSSVDDEQKFIVEQQFNIDKDKKEKIDERGRGERG
jgi:carbonic anhydrase/acetyltransferase-like protein (isoleucine patch superfamily)